MATFKRTDEHYAAGSLTLPQAYYTSEEVFARETDRIFRADWYCAGHASRIPNPGEYFLLNVFNESLIVVRDKQGGIRAFYNVCRHRGTRICEEGEGRFSGSIQCSYHAWTYGLDGRLIGAPFMKDVPGFDWEEYPLKAAPVHMWEGFIFVHLGMEAPPAFEETHGALLGRFEAWKLRAAAVARPHHVRGPIQLEVHLPELQRVLSLPDDPSAAEQADGLHQRHTTT